MHEAAAPQIGEALRVSQLIRGSVQQAGDALRVNMQLIDTTSGETRWAETVRGSRDALFELQDAIAQRLAAQLGARGLEFPRAGDVPNAAYADYLAALAVARGHYIPDSGSELELLDRALERAPDFVDAHVLAAQRTASAFWFANMERPEAERRLDRHEAALERLDATGFDRTLVHAIRVYYLDFDPAAAAALLDGQRAAVTADQEATGYYAAMLRRIGRIDEAVALLNRNMRREPGDLSSLVALAELYFWTGNAIAAMELLDGASER